jgi:type I restriction enzyme, S subunit
MKTNWFQCLPKSWQYVRLKSVVELKSIRESGSSLSEKYVGLENIEPWTGRLLDSSTNQVQSEQEESESKGMISHFSSGDALFGKLRPYLAKAHLAKEPGVCTTELLVMQPHKNVDGKFLLRVILTREFIETVNAETFGVKMPRADWNTVSNVVIPLPPLSQQRRISDYLDRTTQSIDSLIAAKKRLLELLAEKRRSIITQAVTRGLTANVPMKDSGIEWLGEMPQHWNLVRIKYIAAIGNGSTPLRDEALYWQGGSFPWLSSTVVNDDIIPDATEFVTEDALKQCHLPIVKPNSVLVAITGQGKTRGKAALLTYQATINQHMAFITPLEKLLDSNFLQLYLTSVYKVLRMISEGMGSTKGALTCEQLADFMIPLPSLVEQKELVSKLQDKIQYIDGLSGAAVEAIALLQERRTSLISAAVTGQLQIPD